MRFTITADAVLPSKFKWGLYNAKEALDQAEGLVARGIRGVKITTSEGRSYDVGEFRRFIRRAIMRG
jgi:hypothetical protein